MVLVQRDEGDLLRRNLTYHRDTGFDEIVVVDNCSTDSRTLEILDHVRTQPGIAVISDSRPAFDQAGLANMGIAHLLERGNVDWVFPCDADEFFWFADGLPAFLARCETKRLRYGSIGWLNGLPERADKLVEDPCWYLGASLFYTPFPEKDWQQLGHFRKSFCRVHYGMAIVVGGHYFRRQANPTFFRRLPIAPASIADTEAAIFHFEYRDGGTQLIRKWSALACNQIIPDAPPNAPWFEKRDRTQSLCDEFGDDVKGLHSLLVADRRTLWRTPIPLERLQLRFEIASYFGF